ncbi:MAG TPA: ABC transporter permease subunit [Acidimicrobiales bacterium]|jgi:Cu-processing system permease protein|nr:ABC transporter permease subunit [Acidimicrobiales bacterium]
MKTRTNNLSIFSLNQVRTISKKVIREARRDRWFWLYCIGFMALAVAITIAAVPNQTLTGSKGFGRTAASLVVLVQLVVPLMTLTLGARYISGERDSGTLVFLLCHPVSRLEVLFGTFLGLAGSLFAAVVAGFGAAGLFSALRDTPIEVGVLLKLAGLSWLLALTTLALGMCISVVTRRASTALGIALFVWMALVFLGDLGIMGSTVATRLPVELLFLTAVINPIEAFRLASVVVLDGSLDVLGPAGIYAVNSFGSTVAFLAIGVLIGWMIFSSLAAGLIFRRGDQI